MNADKKASKIKSEMEGWQKIADALSIEYSKDDRTTGIQSLLELCGSKSVDNRTVSPELQSTVKRLCIAHGIQFDGIPTGLEDAYNYADTMKKKCGSEFENIKDEYNKVKRAQCIFGIGLLSFGLVAIFIAHRWNLIENQESEESQKIISNSVLNEATKTENNTVMPVDDYEPGELYDSSQAADIYSKAEEYFQHGSYDSAATQYKKIWGYKDSRDKWKESVYQQALKYIDIDYYKYAYDELSEIEGYKDSNSVKADVEAQLIEQGKVYLSKGYLQSAYDKFAIIKDGDGWKSRSESVKADIIDAVKSELNQPATAEYDAISGLLDFFVDDEECQQLLREANKIREDAQRVANGKDTKEQEQSENYNYSETEWERKLVVNPKTHYSYTIGMPKNSK